MHEIRIGDSIPRRSREQIRFLILCGILLLAFVQMAMQLFIYDNAKRSIGELEHIDQTATQRLKQRELQMLAILHNQDQIENATNSTLSKIFKMETVGK